MKLQTHNVALARPIAEFVVSMKHGRVFSKGSVSQVMAKDHSLVIEVEKEEESLEKADEEIEAQLPLDEPKSDGKLIVAEEIALGHIRWPACMSFAIA